MVKTKHLHKDVTAFSENINQMKDKKCNGSF